MFFGGLTMPFQSQRAVLEFTHEARTLLQTISR